MATTRRRLSYHLTAALCIAGLAGCTSPSSNDGKDARPAAASAAKPNEASPTAKATPEPQPTPTTSTPKADGEAPQPTKPAPMDPEGRKQLVAKILSAAEAEDFNALGEIMEEEFYAQGPTGDLPFTRTAALKLWRVQPRRLDRLIELLKGECSDANPAAWECPREVEDVEEYGDIERIALHHTDGRWRWDVFVSDEPAKAPATALTSATAVAEALGNRVRTGPARRAFSPELLDGAGPIAVVVFQDACDDSAAECTSRENLPDGPAFKKWLKEMAIDPPGLDVAEKLSSCTDECCTFRNLGRQVAKEELSLPHELLELRAVCFDVNPDGTRRLRRVKFIQH